MIDCPICHVKNNDDARFCAECGQRLSAQTGPTTGPVEAAPPPAPRPAPQQDQGRRLHSPLLGGEALEGGEISPQQAASGEVNRLRQMSARQQDPPAMPPERQFKNPYDPRNDPRNLPPEGASPPQAQDQRKLRSPLLSGEEFDEEPYYEEEPPSNARGGSLRSPLLGGGGGGGEGGGSFRSPLLGRGQGYEDYDEEPQGGGGGLRSPLLGGGAGGAGYSGSDRRRPPAPADTPYGGNERRRGGLRSPILGGGDDEYGGYDDYYDDEPVDEDNPNVLRSPLLAAKRPLTDRPRNEPAPTNSHMQHPPRPGEVPDLGPNQGKPSSSYTSLRAIQHGGNAPAPQTAPQAVPPMPQQAQPQQAQPPMQMPQQPQQPPSSVPPTSVPPSFQSQPSGPPTNVPPSFQQPVSAAPASVPPSFQSPQAQPVRPPEPTTEPITIQPPTPSRSLPAYGTDKDESESAPPRNIAKGRPKLLSSSYEDEEATDDYAPAPYGNYGVQPQGGGGPLPKILGGIGVVLLIMKGLAFKDFMATDWAKVAWLMTDQLIMMGLIVAFIVLCFTRRD